jgi:hypothetical protein
LPDLTHVKVLPEAIEVMPTVLQDVPALTAAFTGIAGSNRKRIEKNAISLLIMLLPYTPTDILDLYQITFSINCV